VELGLSRRLRTAVLECLQDCMLKVYAALLLSMYPNSLGLPDQCQALQQVWLKDSSTLAAALLSSLQAGELSEAGCPGQLDGVERDTGPQQLRVEWRAQRVLMQE
jgi:hypothetical protein